MLAPREEVGGGWLGEDNSIGEGALAYEFASTRLSRDDRGTPQREGREARPAHNDLERFGNRWLFSQLQLSQGEAGKAEK